jgi:WD40 repeat protein
MLLTASVLLAQEAAPPSPNDLDHPKQPALAPDRAALEVEVPPGAKVSVDGQDAGGRRRFEYRGLEAGRRYRHKVEVRFAGGATAARDVWLQGSWHVGLPLVAPAEARPELLLQTGHSSEIGSVAFSPDGKRALTGSRDGTAILWDVATGQQLCTFRGGPGPVAFNPDDNQVFTCSGYAGFLWEANTGKQLQTFQKHEGDVSFEFRSAVFSRDGERLLADGWYDAPYGTKAYAGRVILWDATSGNILREIDTGGPVSFHPDERLVLVGGLVWDLSTGKKVRTFRKEGKTIEYGRPGKKIQVFREGRALSSPGAFSPDGRKILTENVLWDATTGRRLLTLSDRGGSPVAAFSPDGRTVLCEGTQTDKERVVVLCDSETGRLLHTLRGHTGLKSAVFSPDGRHALTVSGNQAAVLWDAQTGQEVRRLPGLSAVAALAPAAFSPDGRQVLTASRNKAAVL